MSNKSDILMMAVRKLLIVLAILAVAGAYEVGNWLWGESEETVQFDKPAVVEEIEKVEDNKEIKHLQNLKDVKQTVFVSYYRSVEDCELDKVSSGVASHDGSLVMVPKNPQMCVALWEALNRGDEIVVSLNAIQSENHQQLESVEPQLDLAGNFHGGGLVRSVSFQPGNNCRLHTYDERAALNPPIWDEGHNPLVGAGTDGWGMAPNSDKLVKMFAKEFGVEISNMSDMHDQLHIKRYGWNCG